MNFLNKIIAPKEVKAALGTLDEAAFRFPRPRLFRSLETSSRNTPFQIQMQ